jgi:MurNAc alpha-1-phosphate uridylyltransferase
MIDTLMIFAAGFGKRLLPLTAKIPKPLIEVAGKSLLFHNLDFALNFNFKKIIINCHYLHEQIEQAIDAYINRCRPDAEIITIHEPKILETGGGVKNAYKFFQDSEAIFTLNSDSIIFAQPQLWHEMLEKWNPLTMDFYMLLTSMEKSFGSVGRGDFDMNKDGSINMNNDRRRYMFSGLQILKPELINANPNEVFSLSQYYLDGHSKLFGYENKGSFYHISNMKDYEAIAAMKIRR